jgi:hypothetical protein
LSFPLIGRVTAGGMTLRKFETELKKKLADGYFRNPQVTVAVEQYRSQRVFVMGEVRNPGPVPLTGGMTLIEALARAGSTLPSSSGEVAIVRATQGSKGPMLPDPDRAADIVHFRSASRNDLCLRPGQEPWCVCYSEEYDCSAGVVARRRRDREWRDEPDQSGTNPQGREEGTEGKAYRHRESR